MKVAVIGCGPSGMMCAYQAALRGLDVVIYDPNEKAGRKLRITGKGRCNICNDCDIKTVMANIPGDGRFLYSALNRFSPSDVKDFFETNGLKLKTERGNRVFPLSDNANDVANLMFNLCKSMGVEFIQKRITNLDSIDADAVVIATGGLSYPLTGSVGDGYTFAKSLGHNVTECKGSLVPLESDDLYCMLLQGFSLKNVAIKLFENEKLIFTDFGEMLFTHFGVSGPLILSASSHINDASKCRLEIDLKPALDDKKLDERILRDFSENQNKLLINYLPSLTGKSLAPIIYELCGFEFGLKVNQVTHDMRRKLRNTLKSFPVNIISTRPVSEAIVTKGGVDVKEINPRTMQSKINPKYYFVGEVLNLDAYTGGFNLQIAWSTGYVAGMEVLNG